MPTGRPLDTTCPAAPTVPALVSFLSSTPAPCHLSQVMVLGFPVSGGDHAGLATLGGLGWGGILSNAVSQARPTVLHTAGTKNSLRREHMNERSLPFRPSGSQRSYGCLTFPVTDWP